MNAADIPGYVGTLRRRSRSGLVRWRSGNLIRLLALLSFSLHRVEQYFVRPSGNGTLLQLKHMCVVLGVRAPVLCWDAEIE